MDGLMVAAGAKVALSADDGLSWETTIPDRIEVHGVAHGGSTFVVVGELGLLLFSPDARTWTRRDSPLERNGSLYRTLWDRKRIALGAEWLARAARGETFSRFHAEAGIAAEHYFAPSFGQTRWNEIAELYTLLERAAPRR